ncbi:hypothetical protein T265_05096 [Opisthorchis viverrini]|uniref:Uncharacterized protein n=1 Tax=Opisthorchis viverrini TaxID=6198 RepID=A0A074ZKU8_OPIVI|nr:hypothetical protein T265_05096 [Opisthorchis viverrini]KER27973.1 hypothetical protein T265_05096 [Opisthorchis viverrini]
MKLSQLVEFDATWRHMISREPFGDGLGQRTLMIVQGSSSEWFLNIIDFEDGLKDFDPRDARNFETLPSVHQAMA